MGYFCIASIAAWTSPGRLYSRSLCFWTINLDDGLLSLEPNIVSSGNFPGWYSILHNIINCIFFICFPKQWMCSKELALLILSTESHTKRMPNILYTADICRKSTARLWINFLASIYVAFLLQYSSLQEPGLLRRFVKFISQLYLFVSGYVSMVQYGPPPTSLDAHHQEDAGQQVEQEHQQE